MAFSADAGGYQLGLGDLVMLDHSGIEDPLPLTVNADGAVRLAAIGSVSVAGLTLDEAEATVEEVMKANGFFVNPEVGLTVREYAPVIVGGDVAAPGRYAYAPGMTVAVALALSGGGQGRGLSQTEVSRAQTDAKAGMLTANFDIALAVARLARFEAVLSGKNEPLKVTAIERRRIPAPAAVDLLGIVRNEAEVLASQQARARQLLASWEQELATLQAQAENFNARIAVQKDIVKSTQARLASTQELSNRGLQTASRLATAEERAADARARVLELESAKIAAAQAVSMAARARVVFLANQQRDALTGLQDANRELETATYRYHRFQEQGATLSGLQRGALLDPDATRLVFALQTSRQGRPQSQDITLETSLLPGEALIVSAVPLIDDLDG